MTTKNSKKRTILVTLLAGLFLLIFNAPTYAHCDSYDGPVIKDALKALDLRDTSSFT